MDDQGRFKFTVLPQGSYTLSVAHLGFKTLKVKSIRLTAGEGKVLPPLIMDVAPTDIPWLPIPEFALRAANPDFGNLSGRVMHDESRAIARAKIQLLCDEKICGETHADTDGKFIFFNLQPRDDYEIRVTHPGYHPWQWADYRVQAGYDVTYSPIFVALPRRTKLSRAASTVR